MDTQERVSILEHLNTIIELRFSALNKELKLYREEMQRRLEGLNELREDVVKDRSLLIRGDLYYPKVKGLDEKIDLLEKCVDQSEARTSVWLVVLGIALVLIPVVVRLWWK